MINEFLYPNGIAFLVVKLIIFMMVLLIWFYANSMPVV